jgi:putative ABC transport system substrate-binding protein
MTDPTGRRRFVFGAAGLTLVSRLACAQAPPRTTRIGILSFGDPPPPGSPPEPIVAQLRRLGYAEGRNVEYVRRYAGGKRDAYAALARELLRERLDVIYTPGSDIAQTFNTQSPNVPVVFTVSDDPVASGLVRSLARPGGMFTGVTLMSPELAGKRLELLRATLPSLRRVAVLYDPEHRATYLPEMKVAAAHLGVDFVPLKFNQPADFPSAFAIAKKDGADAMFVEPSRFTLVYARRLGELAIENRVAAISAYDLFARSGGLLSYGPRYEEQAVRAAALIDRILNGARPAELPVEQPTRFALVVNLKTAAALGITVPQAVLLRADEVIE